MRRQDEILLLYGGRDPLTRKYLLSELGRLSSTFDAEDAYALLGREMWEADHVVRNQALFTLCGFLPGFVRKRYGLAAVSRSSWTSYSRALPAGAEAGVAGGAVGAGVREALIGRAGLLMERLVGLAGGAPPEPRVLSLLALTSVPSPAVRSQLARLARESADPFPAVMAHALAERAGTGEELARTLLAGAGREPDHLLLTSCLPAALVGPILPELFVRTDTRGRIDLMMALPELAGLDPGPVFALLARRVEVPVVVQALRAMELMGLERWLPLVREIFERSAHEFVRVTAVRAAGGIPGEASLVFLTEALGAPQEPVRAQALESLVRRGAPAEALDDAARPLLASPHLRTRVNALLALASSGETASRLAEPLTQLALGDDVLTRLEAAFCMGYLQSSTNADYLAIYTEQDPALAVRRQAIKSLSRFPPALAVPRLIATLRTADPELAKAAMRALSRFAGDAWALEALVEALRQERDPRRLGMMAACLGRLAAGVRHSAAARAAGELEKLLVSPEPAVQRGAVEGWLNLGGSALGEGTPLLARQALDPSAPGAARLALARLLGGDLEALARLSELVSGPHEAAARVAVETVMELLVMVDAPALSRRFPALTAALGCIEPPAPEPAPGALELSVTTWRVQRPPSAARLSAPTALPRTAELEQHLLKGHVRARSGAEDLELGLDRQNYLVGGTRGAGRGRPLMAVGVGAAVLALTGLIAGWGLSPPPAGTGLHGTARVSHWLVESITGGPPRAPGWSVGRPLQPELPIGTAPGQRVRLVGPGGNRLELAGSSILTPRAVAEDSPDLEVELVAGSAHVELPAAGSLTVRCGATRLHATRCRFRLTRSAAHVELLVEHGAVTVRAPGKPAREVRPGAPYRVEP